MCDAVFAATDVSATARSATSRRWIAARAILNNVAAPLARHVSADPGVGRGTRATGHWPTLGFAGPGALSPPARRVSADPGVGRGTTITGHWLTTRATDPQRRAAGPCGQPREGACPCHRTPVWATGPSGRVAGPWWGSLAHRGGRKNAVFEKVQIRDRKSCCARPRKPSTSQRTRAPARTAPARATAASAAASSTASRARRPHPQSCADQPRRGRPQER